MKRIGFLLAIVAGVALTVGGIAVFVGRQMDRMDRDFIVTLRHAGHIPLDGVEGRIDHMAADLPGGRLFVAALGNNTVEVVDTRTGEQKGRITGIREPQGVVFVPPSGQLFVTSGGKGTCEVYDAATLAHRKSIPLGTDADNLRYDPSQRQVIAGYGDGALAILDATEGTLEGTVKLAGHPEAFEPDPDGKRIYVNVPDAGQVAVVDRHRRSVVATWPLHHAGGNFPMALDAAHGRLFVACRRPAVLLVLDTKDGREVARMPIAGDADDAWYDAARGRVYVSCGHGVVSIRHQDTPDRYSHLQDVGTAPGGRTSIFIPSENRFYVAVPHRGVQIADLQVFRVEP